jgi:putative ABC transport system permease protein
MMGMMHVAWMMLTGDRAKYLGVLFGVALSTMLIVHQVTIFTGLMARTWSVVQDLRDSSGVQIIVSDPATEFLNDARPLAETDLQRVRSVEGVEWAVPMSLNPVRVRAPGGRFRTCVVIGLDDATLLGGPRTFVEGSVGDLRTPDAVIIDRLDAARLLAGAGPDGRRRPPGVGDVLEINDHRAVVAAVSANVRPFLSQPIIYTTYSSAQRWSPPARRGLSYVLVRVRAGEDPTEVARRLERATGLAAATTDRFGMQTVGYFIRNTGIPVNFGITVLLGFIVGMAISGQTFYLFVLDNLRHLAALKAMGTGNARLLAMTLGQAALVGVLGFGLGVGAALLLIVPFRGTELEFTIYWQVVALAAGAVGLIVALASLASLVRVFRVEPALVFKA